MMIDLFDNLNKKIYWIFHEPIPKSCKSKNVIKFEPSGHLHDFIHLNKALLDLKQMEITLTTIFL